MGFKTRIRAFLDGLVWWIVNSFISGFPSIAFRNWALRLFGVKMTRNVRFYQGFHIRKPSNIIIREGVSIGPKVLLDGRCGLEIGNNVVIGYEAIIWSLNHDYNDEHFKGKGGKVSIGDYAWICSRSIILPGIQIGEGAIVASGAVVTKDVAPYTIVGGIPARVIGKRDNKEYQYGYNASKVIEYFV